MLKKWLLPGALVLALALLGLSARWWLPPLLDLAGKQSSQIQGLASLVQIVLWIAAAIVAVIRLGLLRRPEPPAPARPDAPPSIGRLDLHVEAPEAADFLRRLGLTAPPADRIWKKPPRPTSSTWWMPTAISTSGAWASRTASPSSCRSWRCTSL